jgi:ABC-2 type transport system permease protein
MRNIPVLLRREWSAYFTSIVGYVCVMIFLLVMGFFFVAVVARTWAQDGPSDLTPIQGLFYLSWVPVMFVVPALTMRLFAEEKRAGTVEMLMTAPVSDYEVVVAKYLGAVLLYLVMWSITILYAFILEYFSSGTSGLDFGPMWGGYLCMALMGQFFISLGLLASSLTRNQVIAFILSFAVICVYVFGPLLAPSIMGGLKLFEGDVVRPVVAYFSIFDQIKDFSRGMIDLRPVVLYVTGSVFVLFLTTRVVESRKWR